jgi:DNA-binding response OmpR family regulator
VSAGILIAEDDASILLSLEFLLRNAGYAVTAAATGDAAWRALDAAPPRLAILDVMLPAIDGLELTRRMRADGRFAQTRIVILSARGRDFEVLEGLKRGADAYVTKPFGTRDLLDEVARLLEN